MFIKCKYTYEDARRDWTGEDQAPAPVTGDNVARDLRHKITTHKKSIDFGAIIGATIAAAFVLSVAAFALSM